MSPILSAVTARVVSLIDAALRTIATGKFAFVARELVLGGH